jgi:hypothetical protein
MEIKVFRSLKVTAQPAEVMQYFKSNITFVFKAFSNEGFK